MADKYYFDRRSIRGKTAQIGGHVQFLDQHPSYYRLKIFEKMYHQDSTINKSLHTVVDSVLSSVGIIAHPDEEIANFHNNMLSSIEDNISRAWKSLVSEFYITQLWAGFSVAEINFDVKNGELVLDDLVTYNPRSITIRTNNNGKLTDNEPTRAGYRSGIYQSGYHGSEVRLPLWKVLYQSQRALYGDYLGRSCLAPAYKWYRLKDYVTDLMITTLGRGASPLSYIIMRSYETDEQITDPTTGEPRSMTSLEYVDQQISQVEENGRNILLLPRVHPDDKIDIGTLTTGNNLASSFIDALNYIDQQMVNALMVPLMYINSKASPTGEEIVERTIDKYFRSIQLQREILFGAFIRQVLMPIQLWNFNRESAKIFPEVTISYGERSEDRVATMQVIKGLASIGSLNPRNQSDADLMRDILSLPKRQLTKDDIEFIDLINKTGFVGRPVGVSSPLQEPRAKTKKKMVDPTRDV